MKNHVREFRTETGLSQTDLGDAVGATRQTIDAIERERYDPSLQLAFEFAAYFGCRVEDVAPRIGTVSVWVMMGNTVLPSPHTDAMMRLGCVSSYCFSG